MTGHSPTRLLRESISFLGTSSGLHLQKDKLCITIIRFNDLETVNYKIMRESVYVCARFSHVSGFQDR